MTASILMFEGCYQPLQAIILFIAIGRRIIL